MCPKLLFSKTVSDFEPFEIIFLRCEVTWFKHVLKPNVIKKNRTACACHFIYSIKKLYHQNGSIFWGTICLIEHKLMAESDAVVLGFTCACRQWCTCFINCAFSFVSLIFRFSQVFRFFRIFIFFWFFQTFHNFQNSKNFQNSENL